VRLVDDNQKNDPDRALPCRETERKRGTHTRNALNFDFSVMIIYYSAADGQAEPVARLLCRKA
jgi:hypothetical protein